ncbi:MAG: PAS domain S-box protein, partial [Gemmatimonadetes bacterium]|nr:PAS domain S-box protein [Gemmatimonadota bacterium]
MTTPAALSATACAIEALVGLLSLAFSAAPGWRHLRLFSLVAFTAAIYSASGVPQTLDVSAQTIIWASRLSLLAAALHLACWIVYSATAPEDRPRLGRLDWGALGLLGGVAILAPIPGVLAADAMRVHEVSWLGLRYSPAEATLLGTAAFPLLLAATLIPAARYVRRARQRVPGARAHAVGFGVLLLTAVSEALVALGIVHGPYLMDIGFLAAVIAIVGEMSRRVVAEARALAESSSRLERQVAERTGELRRSEERYRRLLEGMTDAYAAVSMDGAILEANEAFQQLVGRSMDELRHLTARDLTPEPWREAEERIVAEQVIRSGSSDVYEKELWRRNGTVVPVELRTFLIRGPDGEPVGMWAIVRDITARKEAQAERERLWERIAESQRLESLGRLAGGVAHDFNNLLTVVLGSAESLARDLREGHGTDGEDLAQIEAAALRARDLTTQLLGFARKQIIRPRVLDLNDFLHIAERLLRR